MSLKMKGKKIFMFCEHENQELFESLIRQNTNIYWQFYADHGNIHITAVNLLSSEVFSCSLLVSQHFVQPKRNNKNKKFFDILLVALNRIYFGVHVLSFLFSLLQRDAKRCKRSWKLCNLQCILFYPYALTKPHASKTQQRRTQEYLGIYAYEIRVICFPSCGRHLACLPLSPKRAGHYSCSCRAIWQPGRQPSRKQNTTHSHTNPQNTRRRRD